MKCPRCNNPLTIRDGIAVAILQGEPEDLPDEIGDDARYVDNVICKIAECKGPGGSCGYTAAGFLLNGKFFDDYDMVPLSALWERTKRNRENQGHHRHPEGEPSD